MEAAILARNPHPLVQLHRLGPRGLNCGTTRSPTCCSMSKLHEPSSSRSADGLYRQHRTTKEPRNEPCRRRFESIRPICMVDLSIINLSGLGLKLDQVTSLSFLLTSNYCINLMSHTSQNRPAGSRGVNATWLMLVVHMG